jgi:hypothetical protein
MELRLLQVFFAETTHADALGLRRRGALEYQRMMASLGNAAQVQRVVVLVADDEADQIDVERAALAEVLDMQHRVAGAGDVERRTIVRERNGHSKFPLSDDDLSHSWAVWCST